MREVGVEGTGNYGAGLAHLAGSGRVGRSLQPTVTAEFVGGVTDGKFKRP